MSVRGALMVGVLAMAAPALGQHEQHGASTSPASADLSRCVQTQAAIGDMLTAAALRLESARQSNSAATMRATLAEFDGLLRQLREQLAPCSRLQVTVVTAPPLSPPQVVAPPVAPAKVAAPPTPVAAPPTAVAAPTVPVAANEDHSNHTAPPPTTPVAAARPAPPPAVTPPSPEPQPIAKPVAAAAQPAATRPATRTATPPVPAAATRPAPVSTSEPDAHADHARPSEPSVTAAASGDRSPVAPAPAKPAGPARAEQATPRRTAATSTPTFWATQVELLRCTTGVAGKGAPQSTYQGTTYFFCSEHDRQNFLRNPAAAINGRGR